MIAPGRGELDLGRVGSLDQQLGMIRPDVVVNAAAYTQVDRAEQERDAAFAVNAAGAGRLAHAAAAVSARFIQLSTDFVFDGSQATPYSPDAPTNPLGVYGLSKRDGEAAVLDATHGAAVVLRTAWVYDAVSRNFVTTMLRLMEERSAVRVVADQVGTPTASTSLAATVWAIIGRPELRGVHHWTDGGVASWYDFAVAIERLGRSMGYLSRPASVTPIRAVDFPALARRPAYSVLDKTATSGALGLEPRHWEACLADVLGARRK